MERIVEPELMTDEEQARAYAEADFESAHSRYPLLFREIFPDCPPTGRALDIGCGPGDVTRRFAQILPNWDFDAVDGSAAMLAQAPPTERITYIQGFIPGVPLSRYDLVLTSSLLHHLTDPSVLWQTIRRCASNMVFVVDLRRPSSREDALKLTDKYTQGEPEVLRRDFFNSLLAAFTIEEVERQLKDAGLSKLPVREISDRHLLVAGYI